MNCALGRHHQRANDISAHLDRHPNGKLQIRYLPAQQVVLRIEDHAPAGVGQQQPVARSARALAQTLAQALARAPAAGRLVRQRDPPLIHAVPAPGSGIVGREIGGQALGAGLLALAHIDLELPGGDTIGHERGHTHRTGGYDQKCRQ